MKLSEFRRGRIIEFKRGQIEHIGESLVIWVEVMRPLEDAGKNGWTTADFSVMKRRLGHRADPSLTVARHTGPRIGVKVWSAVSFDNRTSLVVIRGTIKAHRYLDDIL
ncbi:hypothetical protein TNCV_417221 [Trichonephila clavipes]|nr:hypothetical protein TNCV_417221 [Trichonephila clavipes]